VCSGASFGMLITRNGGSWTFGGTAIRKLLEKIKAGIEIGLFVLLLGLMGSMYIISTIFMKIGDVISKLTKRWRNGNACV